MPELDWMKFQRILVMRLDNIGDVIMTGPFFRALRSALPAAHLTLMASPAGSQAALMLPWIDEVLVDRVVWQDASGTMPLDPERELKRILTLRDHQFDAAFILTSFSQSPFPAAYACYLAGISVRIGQSKEFGGSVLSHWQKSPPDQIHQVDRNLSLLKFAGIPLAGRHLELSISQEIQAQASDRLQAAGVNSDRPYVVLAPGASCSARRYDPLRFAEVSSLLSAQTGLPIVLVGNARERELVSPFLGRSRPVTYLVGETTVPELAAVIRGSALVLANDSAPMHIAEAFLKPMVVLYSGTELEEQWQPRFAPARLLRQPTDCSPCYNFRCPYSMECLDFPAEDVVAAALAQLSLTSDSLVGYLTPQADFICNLDEGPGR